MYYWRVTKYNPQYRDGNAYLLEEWTSVSDIGKCFYGTKFTVEEYLKCEEQYINAVILAMRAVGINELKIEEIEKKEYSKQQKLVEPYAEGFYNLLYNGMFVNINEIGLLIKLILREMVWGKLDNEKFFVHFGYDYYMYMGIPNMAGEIKEKIEKIGLFVENVESPYLH